MRTDDPDHGDSFFKEVSASVLAKVSGGDLDPRAMLTAIQAGIDGGILFLSAVREIQSRAETMQVGGAVPTTTPKREQHRWWDQPKLRSRTEAGRKLMRWMRSKPTGDSA